MKKLLFIIGLLLFPIISLAQITGNGQGKAWVVLTSNYNTSPFNSTTDLNVFFDGADYNGHITSVQFKIGYDGNAFTAVDSIVNLLGNQYVLNYNDDADNNNVLISIVYTGSSSTQTMPDGAIVTLKFTNIPPALIYTQEQNRSSFNFSGFTPIGSNSLGNDVTLASLNHGGNIKIPHRRYFGFIQDYRTKTGIPNLEYQLIKNSGPGTTGTLQTVLSNQQPTKTNVYGYYELIYYEHYYGYFVEGQTEFSFLFKTEDLSGTTSSNPPALSTTDSYLQLRFATGKSTYLPIQLLASDVNQSHTSTIADAYSSFARFSNRFSNWQNLGPGGYRDIMIIDPKDVKYLEHENTTTTQLGIGPLGFKPKMTNWTYVLKNYIDYDGPNSHSGEDEFEKDFYIVLMGDVNGSGLGGQLKPGSSQKAVSSIEMDTTDTMFVTLAEVGGAVGETVLVDFDIYTRNVGVSSFGLQLNYNSSIIEFLGANVAALPSSWMLYFNSDSLNTLDFGGIDGSAGDFPIQTSDKKTLIQFKFKILNNTQIEVPLIFSDTKTAGDILGNDMEVVSKDGILNTNEIPTPIIPPVDFPKAINLSSAYPNPFNPSTNIQVDIPQGGSEVEITIYDGMGRVVSTLFEGRLIGGTHTFRFNAENLASGIYIYQLRSVDGVIAKKMALVK